MRILENAGYVSEVTKLLAEAKDVGCISECQCGCIHLTVGAVTVRLAPETFVALTLLCVDAARKAGAGQAMQERLRASPELRHVQ